MPVVLGLGGEHGPVEVLVVQRWIDDLVAVLDQVRRLDSTGNRMPAVKEEYLHRSSRSGSGSSRRTRMESDRGSRSPAFLSHIRGNPAHARRALNPPTRRTHTLSHAQAAPRGFLCDLLHPFFQIPRLTRSSALSSEGCSSAQHRWVI